jgi:hypothetical protein
LIREAFLNSEVMLEESMENRADAAHWTCFRCLGPEAPISLTEQIVCGGK